MNETEKSKHSAPVDTIGRCKTVWVFPDGQGIITTIIVRKITVESSDRLVFSGNVTFSDDIKDHIQNAILPISDDIVQSLDIPPCSFDLSAVNISAASSMDQGVALSGFSLDITVFLAMLSAALKLPLRQDIVYTGHIASPDGDIAIVKNIPEKAQVAVRDKSITTFVYPDLDNDISLQSLKPEYYDIIDAEMRGYRGKMTLSTVKNIADLIEKTLDPEAIVMASLRSGYYTKPKKKKERQHSKIIEFLLGNNNRRFWDSLEKNIFEKNSDKTRELMKTFSKYHLTKKMYPHNFGATLYNLVLSLPSSVRDTKGLFPLLDKTTYIKLITRAKEKDHDDISLLHDALYDRNIQAAPGIKPTVLTIPAYDKAEDVLNYLYDQLNDEKIISHVLSNYDKALATFNFGKVTVENYTELITTLTSFIIHVTRHTTVSEGSIDHEKIESEAIDIFNKVYPGKAKNNEAIVNSQKGFNGGMNGILNTITNYLKNDAREKHKLTVVTKTIDPLDYSFRTKIIQKIMEKGKSYLPEDILSQPPEKFADDYAGIIFAYIESFSKLCEIMRKY